MEISAKQKPLFDLLNEMAAVEAAGITAHASGDMAALTEASRRMAELHNRGPSVVRIMLDELEGKPPGNG